MEPAVNEQIEKRYGRMTIISDAGKNKWGYKMVECLCDCGNRRIVSLYDLKRSHTTSCGCLRIDKLRADNTTHGLSKTPTHNSWRAMLERCNRPAHQFYLYYGGRGIAVCKRWMTFENFLADMGLKPKGKSLDRIDPNGNYEPGNCRWATSKEQARNVSNIRTITHNGKTQTIAAWADDLGVKVCTLHMRLFRGWSVADTLERPIKEEGTWKQPE